MSLHDAARGDDVAKIQELLAKGTLDVEGRDRHSRTALHLAAWAGKVESVNALLDAQANVNAAAMDDTNALHFAAQKGHLDVCKVLISRGVPVVSKTRKGMDALQFAAQNGNLELVNLLLQKKANPAAQNKKGQTAADLTRDDGIKAVLAEAAAQRSQIAPGSGMQSAAADGSGTAAGNQSAGSKRNRQHVRKPAEQRADMGTVSEAAIGPTAQPAAAIGPAAGTGGNALIGPAMPPSTAAEIGPPLLPSAASEIGPAAGPLPEDGAAQGPAVQHSESAPQSEQAGAVAHVSAPVTSAAQQFGEQAASEPAAKKQRTKAPQLSHLGNDEEEL